MWMAVVAMGKITFRADDDLVDELETFDVSKSEVMREALRSYLDRPASNAVHSATESADEAADDPPGEPSLDDVLTDRIDAALDDRLADRAGGEATDVNVRITVDADGCQRAERTDSTPNRPESIPTGTQLSAEYDEPDGGSDTTPRNDCGQCGMTIDATHVYCPNCGERAAHRVFCECGDKVRSDWAFCPSCGRRTPAADVLDSH